MGAFGIRGAPLDGPATPPASGWNSGPVPGSAPGRVPGPVTTRDALRGEIEALRLRAIGSAASRRHAELEPRRIPVGCGRTSAEIGPPPTPRRARRRPRQRPHARPRPAPFRELRTCAARQEAGENPRRPRQAARRRRGSTPTVLGPCRSRRKASARHRACNRGHRGTSASPAGEPLLDARTGRTGAWSDVAPASRSPRAHPPGHIHTSRWAPRSTGRGLRVHAETRKAVTRVEPRRRARDAIRAITDRRAARGPRARSRARAGRQGSRAGRPRRRPLREGRNRHGPQARRVDPECPGSCPERDKRRGLAQ